MSYAQRVAGITFVAFLAVLGMVFILSYSPNVVPFAPAYEASLPQWFLSYRLFDIFFLGLLIFAAIIATSALFRPEKLPEPSSEEEVEEED